MTNLKQYLDSLKALEARATPGFWFQQDRILFVKTIPILTSHGVATTTLTEDAAFIAASRNALPKLIEALEETVGALEVCDLALKAAKPCVTGGRDMNENIAADALSRVNALIGEAK